MITQRKESYPAGNRKNKRSGAALAEFAILLPLLLVLVFGAIEACTMIFLKQTLTVAAYEGARIAVDKGATTSASTAAAQQVLDDRSVVNGTIATIPASIESAVAGDEITITVTAPCNSNTVLQGWFFNNSNLTGQVVMMKEF